MGLLIFHQNLRYCTKTHRFLLRSYFMGPATTITVGPAPAYADADISYWAFIFFMKRHLRSIAVTHRAIVMLRVYVLYPI